MGLLCVENCMILTSTVFDWSTRVTDRQTDGRNCDSICALSIYAVARKNPRTQWMLSSSVLCSSQRPRLLLLLLLLLLLQWWLWCVCVDMSPTDYRVNNESLLIGGEVCLWTEFADDDSITPRLWSVCVYECIYRYCALLWTQTVSVLLSTDQTPCNGLHYWACTVSLFHPAPSVFCWLYTTCLKYGCLSH